ncbi:MAG: hypothetical protein GF328_09430 [Candidatus Latescibacteria bacterium]|nr:hypothetical protein [Candidatus Latescibacterota bacterium]
MSGLRLSSRVGPVVSISSILLLLAAVLSLHGCGRDRLEPETENPPATDWEFGETATYEIGPSTESRVADDLTGNLFCVRDPQGGTLSVTRVINGPQAAPEDSAFSLSYTGSETVQILIPHDPTDYDFVFGYVPFDGVILEGDEGADSGWLPFPVTETAGDTLVVDLLIPSTPKRADHARWQGITNFKKLKIDGESDHGILMGLFDQNIRNALHNLILVVPPERRQQAMLDIEGPLEPTLFVSLNSGSWWRSKPKYVPFWTFVPLIPRCALMMKDDYAGSVAHEVGHYLHHVLVGNNLYVNFAMDPRPYDHKIGKPGARENVIEEPAYFAEYVLNRTINSGNPEQGTFLTSADGVTDPKEQDFVDLEGMGLMILASVTRQSNEIFAFSGGRTRVPVVTGNLNERYQACYEAIAQGANTIPAFRYKMQVYLSASGQQDKLPAMLQPLGWSHFAEMRFVDEQGRPVSGHTARSVCVAGGETYRLPTGRHLPDTPGGYALDRVFPGESILRVYRANGDSVDVPRSVDWFSPTNQKLQWGDIQMTESVLPALHQTRRISARVYGDHRAGADRFGDPSAFRPEMPGLQWNGTAFHREINETWGSGDGQGTSTEVISGTVSANGMKILSLSYTWTSRFTAPPHDTNEGTLITRDVTMTISNVEFEENSFGDIQFYVGGPETANHATLFYHQYVDLGTPGEEPSVTDYTHTDWNSQEHYPSISVYFFKDEGR